MAAFFSQYFAIGFFISEISGELILMISMLGLATSGRKLPIVVIEEISLKRCFRRDDPVCSAGNCLSRRRNDTSSVSCFRSFRHIQMKKCDLHFSPFYTCINFIQIYFNTILYQKYIFRQNFIIFSDSYSIWSALFIPPC